MRFRRSLIRIRSHRNLPAITTFSGVVLKVIQRTFKVYWPGFWWSVISRTIRYGSKSIRSHTGLSCGWVVPLCGWVVNPTHTQNGALWVGGWTHPAQKSTWVGGWFGMFSLGAKRELWMQVCSSGDHQGTAHRNHYSPNRAATQVSMKYRVKRNQCQDHILNPTSTAGQVRK